MIWAGMRRHAPPASHPPPPLMSSSKWSISSCLGELPLAGGPLAGRAVDRAREARRWCAAHRDKRDMVSLCTGLRAADVRAGHRRTTHAGLALRQVRVGTPGGTEMGHEYGALLVAVLIMQWESIGCWLVAKQCVRFLLLSADSFFRAVAHPSYSFVITLCIGVQERVASLLAIAGHRHPDNNNRLLLSSSG